MVIAIVALLGVVNYGDDVGGECNAKWQINMTRLELLNGNTDSLSFSSRHGAGSFFLFADGTVRFISQSININTYGALAGINDGGPADSDF